MSDEIGRWLAGLGLGRYADLFARNEISPASLRLLTDNDLKELGLPLGPRRIVGEAIAALRDGGAARSIAQRDSLGQRNRSAERRQLTVLFCDLVDSTTLSGRLDPEDLRDVIRQYQDTVAEAVARYEGHVARYLGDGVLAYFGWPHAHEDQAQRALLAGLQAVRAVSSIPTTGSEYMQARVGIATGRVVVGDIIGVHSSDAESVSGQTPNLAARLQTIAQPGQVVIGAVTRRLIGSAFELEELQPIALKGFDEPISMWAVIGQRIVDSRFDATYRTSLSTLVGRDRELQQLKLHWEHAVAGRGQVIFLSGEAGIGKSRVAQTFCRMLAMDDHPQLSLQCSSLDSNSAFQPLIQRLERMAKFEKSDDAAAKLEKLEDLLAGAGQEFVAALPLIAELLSIPLNDAHEVSDLKPQQRRDRTIEALVDLILSLGRSRPLSILVEDAHWIDPSSAAFLDVLIPRVAAASVLLVITFRPEAADRWRHHGQFMRLELDRLDRPKCRELVAEVSGEELPAPIVERILERADGVPLYLEELTRAVVENNRRFDIDSEHGDIPSTLDASLMSRLDRLGEAKELVQIGAVIGRTFSPRLVAAIVERPVEQTTATLDNVVATGLITREVAGQDAGYAFRHSLIQDVAYKTLLRQQRRRVHARIAEIMPAEFASQVDAAPEQVAHHCSLARLSEQAVEYWLRAGRRAAERSAHVEAISHLRSGLAELAHISPSRACDEQEFDLRIALGASLLTVESWSSPKVAENYQRARELGLSGGNARQLFVAIRGLSNVYFLNGEIHKARKMVDDLLVMAKDQQDTELLLQSYLPVGMCSLFVGEFETALQCLQQAIALYDRTEHHALAYVYGIDPGVVALSAAGWAQWFLGRPAEARRRSQAALRLADEQQYPFSVAYARSLAASLHQFRRDPAAVLLHADAVLASSQKHDYQYWHGWAGIMRGWAIAANGATSEGIALLQESVRIYEDTGAHQIVPYAQTMLAEMYGWAGRFDKGCAAADTAFGAGNASDVVFFEAEALRIRGELALKTGAADAVDYLRRALALARAQGAPLLALRSAVSIADASRGAADDIEAVHSLLEAFPSGLSEPDVDAARRLLASAMDTGD